MIVCLIDYVSKTVLELHLALSQETQQALLQWNESYCRSSGYCEWNFQWLGKENECIIALFAFMIAHIVNRDNKRRKNHV